MSSKTSTRIYKPLLRNIFFLIFLICFLSKVKPTKLRARQTTQSRATLDVDVETSKVAEALNHVQVSACECENNQEIEGKINLEDFSKLLGLDLSSNSSTDGFIITDERINEKVYQKPRIFENYVLLEENFEILTPTFDSLEGCPKGYRALIKADMDELQNKAGDKLFDILTGTSGLGFNPNLRYILNTKVHPEMKSTSDSSSFDFNGLKFDETAKAVLFLNYNTYFDKNLYYKCILTAENYDLNIHIKGKGINGNIIPLNKENQIFIKNTNIQGVIWNINEEKLSGDMINYTFRSEGCNYIHTWGLLLNHQISYKCYPVYVQDIPESDINTNLNQAQLNYKTFNKNAFKFESSHWDPVSAPLTFNNKNNIIICYTNKQTKNLHLLVLDKAMNELLDKDLGVQASAMDLTKTSNSYVILARDFENKSKFFMYALDKNYDFAWMRHIINTVDQPPVQSTNSTVNSTISNDTVTFKKEDGSYEFGMNNMFRVAKGKISFGGGALGVLFSHWNNFGLNEIGNRMDYFGSSLVMFDENGKNESLGYSWAASPTLDMDLASDGWNFISASLSGGHPDNIQICTTSIFDVLTDKNPAGDLYKHQVSCKNLLQYGILSDGMGGSCGRLGSLVYDGSKTYGVVYSVRACSKNTAVKIKSEFSIILFDTNLKILGFKNFGNGDNIKCLKSVRFGKNIAILYTVSKNPNAAKKIILENTLSSDDESYVMLVDFSGKIINEPIKVIQPFCDEMLTMDDGSIAWTNVGRDNSLTVITVTPHSS